MTETVAPNPYSPYATADPERRHALPVPALLAASGATPAPGTLALTSCGQLAVVPADVILVEPGATFPPIACPPCLEALAADRIDEPPREIELCPECDRPTPYGLCILCRQERHDAWWTEQAHAEAQQRADEADIMRSAGAYDPDYGKDLDYDDEGER